MFGELCVHCQTISSVMQPEAAHAVHGWFKGADEKGSDHAVEILFKQFTVYVFDNHSNAGSYNGHWYF